MNPVILAFIAIFYRPIGLFATEYLQFSHIQECQTDSVVSATFSYRYITLCSSTRYPQIVNAYCQSRVLTFIYHCKTDVLDKKYKLYSAQFCQKRLGRYAVEECKTLTPGFSTLIFRNNVIFDAKFDELTGFSVTSHWPVDENINHKYYCKLRNSHGSLLSNNVIVRDFTGLENRMVKDIDYKVKTGNMAKLKSYDLPQMLDCGVSQGKFDIKNNNLTPFIDSPYKWIACENKGDPTEIFYIDVCYKIVIKGEYYPNLYAIDFHDIFQYFFIKNGSIFVTDIKKYGNYILSCIYQNRLHHTYGSYRYHNNLQTIPVLYTGNKTYPDVEIISPIYQEYILLAGAMAGTHLNTFSLQALFKAKRSVICTWLLNGEALPTSFNAQRHHLFFPDNLISDYSGIYTLSINGQVKFTYNVTIADVPKFENIEDIERMAIVMDGDNIEVPININIADTTKKLQIGENVIDLTNETLFKRSLTNISNNNHEINASIIPLLESGLHNAKFFTYSVANMKYHHNHSHILHVEVSTPYGGEVRASKVIIVLPKPNYIDYPKKYQCVGQQCLTIHYFHVNVDASEYDRFNVFPFYYWYFNDTRIIQNSTNNSSVQTYFTIINDNKTLMLNASKLTEQDKLSLNAAKIKCRLILTGVKNYTLGYDDYIYDSMKHVDDRLVTSFSMMNDSRINIAKIIGFVLLAVAIILIVLIILIVWLVRRKRKYKTYNVDYFEKSMGRDPEEEINRLHVFEEYYRGANDN